MAEYSRGTEIDTDNRVVHKVHRDVWRSVLELGAGPGDTGMAQRVGKSVQEGEAYKTLPEH
jgi:hypothetical protein